MNQKMIVDIITKYDTFVLKTNNYTSNSLTEDRLTFLNNYVLRIKQDSQTDVFIQIKDINQIIGRLKE